MDRLGPASFKAALLGWFILGAGCMDDVAPVFTAPTSQGITSSIGPSPSPSWQPSARPVLGNLTDCRGSLVAFPVPREWVTDDLPSNYTPLETIPGQASLLLTMTTCNKVAVDGRDVGPGSFATLSVGINNPVPPEMPEGVDYFVFLFEVHTDNAALASWLAMMGVVAADGTVTHSHEPPDLGFAPLSTQLVSGQEIVYALTGANHEPKLPVEEHYRHVYGPNPAIDYWDDAVFRLDSGGYIGALQMAETSKMAEILGGLRIEAPPFVAMESITRLIEPPA